MLFIAIISSCGKKPGTKDGYDGESKYQPFLPDGIPFMVADTIWDVDLRGHHRAVILVEQSENDAVLIIFHGVVRI